MASVYLETSFISACVTTRTDAASAYRRDASREWMATQASNHRLAISAEVIVELSRPGYPSRDAALAMTTDLLVLAVTQEVEGMAAVLVQEKVMPGPARGDPIHVAACCVHRMEYLLTWNVRHLANPRKLVHLHTICMRLSVMPPRIITPELLWEKAD